MISIFLSPLYLLVNYYLFRRILKWFHVTSDYFKNKVFKYVLLSIYFLFAISPLIGFLLPKSNLERLLVCTGNYWLGCMLYIFLTICVADIIRIVLKKSKKYDTSRLFTAKAYFYNGLVCIAIIVFICTYGVVNARIVHTTKYDVLINKKVENINDMKVVLVADLHIGYNIGAAQIKRMVDNINAENPDIVVMAGDIFDNSYDAIREPERIKELFKSINSKYGIYAVYGNHDIYEKTLVGFTFKQHDKKMSDTRMDELLKDSNIMLLRDDYVLVDNAFYLIGRADATRPGRDIDVRKSPDELTKDLDKTKPIFVIDHQPRQLEELSDVGVDLDLSGHTHDGQMFPGNVTVGLMWKNPYGKKKYGNMNSVVTSGVGLYGPNMRVGTIAEITSINVKFSE